MQFFKQKYYTFTSTYVKDERHRSSTYVTQICLRLSNQGIGEQLFF